MKTCVSIQLYTRCALRKTKRALITIVKRVVSRKRNETKQVEKTKSGVPSVELAAVPGIERKEKANGYYEILQGRAFGGDGINERFWLARAAAQLLCKKRFECCSAEVIVASAWVLVADQSAVGW
jgi:hypothetical protein